MRWLWFWLMVTSVASAHDVGLRLPFAIKRFDRVTPGFSAHNYDPPLEIFARAEMKFPEGERVKMGLFFDGSLAFVNPLNNPIFGTAAGLKVDWTVVRAEFGLGAVFQSALSKAPYENSQFDTTTFVLSADGEYPFGRFLPGLRLAFLYNADTTVANQEGLETKARRGGTYYGEPRIRVDLDPLTLEAAIAVFSLGNTAIASKEFAFGIPRKTVTRYGLGAGVHFDKVQLWLRGGVLDGVDDIEEQYQQAPYLSGAYLLARQTLSLEASWRF